MKLMQNLLAFSFVIMLATVLRADAYYKNKTQMIETADVIAVVEITKTEKVSIQGKPWIYHQKATAKVEKVLKGTVPSVVSLYGDEDFICARCHFETGRYLVFLDRDGELLRGNNWHLSTRKITKAPDDETAEVVEWLADDDMFKKKVTPLSDALNEVTHVLAKPTEKTQK